MKISKICALVLALAMLLPFAVACGNTKEGTPVTFSNVIIITTFDPDAEAVEAETAETAEEVADESEYEETIYNGEVVVYVETETNEITVLDVIMAYTDDKNVNLQYDSASNRVTKIGEIAAGGGYFWNYLVNGREAGLNTAVTPEDEIEIIFTK